MVLGHTRGHKETNYRKQLDYTIAIVFISYAKLCQYPNFNVFEFFTIIDNQKFTKKLSRGEQPILKLW
jgi:hypothetical protein